MYKISKTLAVNGLSQITSGNVDSGLAVVEKYEEKNPMCSAVVKSQIYAFRSNWSECFNSALNALRQPDQLTSTNIFKDLIELLALSTIRLECWNSTRVSAEELGEIYSSSYLKLHRKVAARLKKFAKLQGKWGQADIEYKLSLRSDNEALFPTTLCTLTVTELLRKFEKKYSGIFDENGQFLLYTLYNFFHENNAVSQATLLYEAAGMDGFNNSLYYITQAYVEIGKSEEAWKCLSSNLCFWCPDDPMQVLPIRLLVNSRISSLLINEDRSEFIQTKPKGPRVFDLYPEWVKNVEKLQSDSARTVFSELKQKLG